MAMRHHPHHSSRGSILVGTAILVAIFAIFMSGVLTYVSNEYRLNFRGHQYTQSLHLAEAAVELGFAELQYQYSQGTNGFSTGRGWVNLGDGSYCKTTNLTDTAGNFVGTLSNRVYVGYTPVTITGVGSATNTVGTLANTERAVSVVLATTSQFQYAIVSKSPLNLSGSAFVDSYNSTDPTKSTGSLYDSSKRQANGNVATTSGLANAGSLSGSADIYGTFASGPGGSVQMSGSGQLGPQLTGQTTSTAQGISNGWIKANFTASPPDAIVPATLTSAANLGTINPGSSGTQTISTGNYQAYALSVVGSSCLTINGNVSLYILGSVTVDNSGSIKLPTGSSLTVYVAGPTLNLAGSGIINNALQPVMNEWYGLSTLNTATITASGNLIGALYAPDAAVTVNGSGAICGALVCSNVVMGGSGIIHYDESLKSGGSGNYSISSWREMRKVNGVWQ